MFSFNHRSGKILPVVNIASAGHVAFDDQAAICSIAIRQFLAG
jgi:hypothetical protein